MPILGTDLVPEIERVMRMIEDTPDANGMFVCVTHNDATDIVCVEMRSHWTIVSHADAAVRVLIQIVIDALAPLVEGDTPGAEESLKMHRAALRALGGPLPAGSKTLN